MEATTLVNRKELARLFHVSEPTVTGWIDAGCPVESQGSNGVAYRFDARKVLAWRKQREADETAAAEQRRAELDQLELELLGGETAQSEDLRSLSPDQRKRALDAELAALRLKRERGELVPVEQVLADFEAVFGLLRQRLLSLAPVLARTLGLDSEQTRIIEGEAKYMLRDLANQIADPKLRPRSATDRDAA